MLTTVQKQLGKNIDRIPTATMDRLTAYEWPGNVRELQNVIERALILSPGPVLRLAEPPGPTRQPASQASGSLGNDLRGIERRRILEALEAARWRIKADGNAASRLGLKPSSLRTRMKRLGIERPS